MSAIIISLQEQRCRSAPEAAADAPLSALIAEATLELWRRHDDLLAVIERLREPALEAHTRFGPLAASLQSTAMQALVEVGLLIRQAEQVSARIP